MRFWLPAILLLAHVLFLPACAGAAQVRHTAEVSRQQAIEKVLEHHLGSSPGAGPVEDPRNPEAALMTWG